MTERGIGPDAQDEIVKQIGSFALYGFPESHAASFALLAYASAYIRAHHPACFLTAMLNHWPLGFYSPATLVKDAQRHGVDVLPIDVQRQRLAVSRHATEAVRLGLRYVDGLREDAGQPDRRASAVRVARRSRAAARSSTATSWSKLAEVGACASLGLERRETLLAGRCALGGLLAGATRARRRRSRDDVPTRRPWPTTAAPA